MPCSQMISMNCRPPRARELRKPLRLPAANMRILNSSRWKSGSDTRVSIQRKAASSRVPIARAAITQGLPQPMALVP